MKTYLFDTFNRFRRYSEKLDVKTILCNRSWLVFNDSGEKETYIFKKDGNMMIVKSGVVTDGAWELLSFNQSIVIRANNQKIMVKPSYVDDVLLALQVDGTDQYAFLIDEKNKERFIQNTYLEVIDYIEAKCIEQQKENEVKEEKKEKTPAEIAEMKVKDIIDGWVLNIIVFESIVSFLVFGILVLGIEDEIFIPVSFIVSLIFFGLLHVIIKHTYKSQYINNCIKKYIKKHSDDLVNQFLVKYIE